MDLKIAAHYAVHKQPKATYECLKSFRMHFPDAPIRLISDNGYNFEKMAQYFKCDYVYEKESIFAESWPWYRFTEHSAMTWLNRVKEACVRFTNVDWIVMLEDDVRTRGPIKHMPTAPIAGPCTMEYQPALKQFIQSKYPWLQIYGYSGCGGSIFHREIFLRCTNNIPNFEEAVKMDVRIRWSDALLTYLFLYNGYTNGPRWLDQSESTYDKGSPDAAFDHQYKVHYDKPWDDSMIGG